DHAGSLSEDPSALSALRRSLGAAAAVVSAALGINALDLARLASAAEVLPGAPPLPLDAPLNLENLTRLYRHATLARSAGLNISDYLTLLALFSANPFADTTACLIFLERADCLRGAGLSVAEADYVVRHSTKVGDGIAPPAETVEALLAELRGELQKIATDNRFAADTSDPNGAAIDPHGDLTRRKLAQLGWEPALTDLATAALTVAADLDVARATAARAFKHFVPNYAVPLAGLPVGLTFPRELAGRVFYDGAALP